MYCGNYDSPSPNSRLNSSVNLLESIVSVGKNPGALSSDFGSYVAHAPSPRQRITTMSKDNFDHWIDV